MCDDKTYPAVGSGGKAAQALQLERIQAGAVPGARHGPQAASSHEFPCLRRQRGGLCAGAAAQMGLEGELHGTHAGLILFVTSNAQL